MIFNLSVLVVKNLTIVSEQYEMIIVQIQTLVMNYTVGIVMNLVKRTQMHYYMTSRTCLFC